MPTSSTSSNGCATTTTGCRRARAGRLLRHGSLCAVYARCGPCSTISRRSIPKLRSAPASAMRASIGIGEDPQAYAYVDTFGAASHARTRSSSSLTGAAATQRRALTGALASGTSIFFAEQNARLVKNAEEYYRTMFRGGAQSWNLRDQHMAGTLEALRDYLSEADRPAKIAVWAHNSHLGDARATQMGQRGELNVGQLMRERFPADTSGRLHHLTRHGDGRVRLGRTG